MKTSSEQPRTSGRRRATRTDGDKVGARSGTRFAAGAPGNRHVFIFIGGWWVLLAAWWWTISTATDSTVSARTSYSPLSEKTRSNTEEK